MREVGYDSDDADEQEVHESMRSGRHHVLQESIDTGDEDDLGNAADCHDEGVFFFVFSSQNMRDGAARAQQHDGDGTRALPRECEQLDVIQLLRRLENSVASHILQHAPTRKAEHVDSEHKAERHARSDDLGSGECALGHGAREHVHEQQSPALENVHENAASLHALERRVSRHDDEEHDEVYRRRSQLRALQHLL